jgi:3-oxosteroid 1-dehydrogenase
MRTWDGFSQTMRVAFRTLGGVLTGRALRAGGNALSARMFAAALSDGIPVWLSSPLNDLIVESGAVVGTVVERDGKPVRVRVRGGVVLAAGGFAHRADLREAHQGIPGWSATSPGDSGTVIEIGQRAGAATAMFDQAWWNPVYLNAEGKPTTILIERSMPFGLMVNQLGVRFVNESASYSNVGHAMVRNSVSLDAPILGSRSPAVPSWLIGDRRLSSRYLYQPALGGKKGKAALTARGEFFEAATLDELADLISVPKATLFATVERFNGFARSGKDLDFQRGESAYDHMYCDPRCKPNPNLGEIAVGPFTALKIYPGDIGTKGGLLTDEHGRAVRDDGTPLEGLYAAGNTTASVMGDTYPGGGSTLGPAIAFGYLAGRHATARYRDRLNSR